MAFKPEKAARAKPKQHGGKITCNSVSLAVPEHDIQRRECRVRRHSKQEGAGHPDLCTFC